jgi:hypothetical protein
METKKKNVTTQERRRVMHMSIGYYSSMSSRKKPGDHKTA